LLSVSALPSPAQAEAVVTGFLSRLQQDPKATLSSADAAALESLHPGAWDVAGPGGRTGSLLAWSTAGDGRQEMAISAGGQLLVLLSGADGNFQTAFDGAGQGTLFVALGDFRGGGHTDVLAINRASDGKGLAASVLAGDGQGGFQARTPLVAEPGGAPLTLGQLSGSLSVTLGDLEGTGLVDLMTVDHVPGSGDLAVNLMTGTSGGGFQAPLSLAVSPGSTPVTASNGATAFSVVAGDLTGDGQVNLLTIGYARGHSTLAISMLSNAGNATFQSHALLALPPRATAADQAPAAADAGGSGTDGAAQTSTQTQTSPPAPQGVPVRFEVGQDNSSDVPASSPPAAPAGTDSTASSAAPPPLPSSGAAAPVDPPASADLPASNQQTGNAPPQDSGPDPGLGFTLWLDLGEPSTAATAADTTASSKDAAPTPAFVVRIDLYPKHGGTASSTSTESDEPAAAPALTVTVGLVVPGAQSQSPADVAQAASASSALVAGNLLGTPQSELADRNSPFVSSALLAIVENAASPAGNLDRVATPGAFVGFAVVLPTGSTGGHRTDSGARLDGAGRDDRSGSGPAAASGEPILEVIFWEQPEKEHGFAAGVFGMEDATLHLLLAARTQDSAPPSTATVAGVPVASQPMLPGPVALSGRSGLAARVAAEGVLELPLADGTTPAQVGAGQQFVTTGAGASNALDAGNLAPFLGTAVYLGSLRGGNSAGVDGALPLATPSDSQMLVAEMVQRFTEAFTRLLQQFYRQFLGRPAAAGEEQGWVQMLLQGHTEESVLGALLGTAEFYDAASARYASGTPDERYIRALYEVVLGRPASESEVSGWLGSLTTLGRTGVATFLLRSQEYRSQQIEQMFQSYWGREGSPAEVAAWAASPLDLKTLRREFEALREAALLAAAAGGAAGEPVAPAI
jgi:hypothetical protein